MIGFCLPVVIALTHTEISASTAFSGETWSNRDEFVNGGAINAWGSDSEYISLELTSCNFTSCISRLAGQGQEQQGHGGAISLWGGKLVLDQCIFNTCTAGLTGGAASVRSGELSANDCKFFTCTADGEGGVVYVDSQNTTQPTLLFKKCEVRDCDTPGPSVLFFTAIQTAEFEENTIENCKSDGTRVLDLTCNSFTWVGNTFDLSIDNTSATVIHIVRNGDGERLIDNSHFSNDNKKVSRFFDLNQLGIWKFYNCSFTGIQTPEESGEGAAIMVNAENGVTDLEVIDCKFTDLACKGNGGAVHVKWATVSIVACCFERCQSRKGYITSEGVELGGSGGAYIEWTSSGKVEDCTFIDNTAAINGQSLQIMVPHDATEIQVIVSNCTFKDHKSPCVLCFGKYTDAWAGKLGDCPFKYTISHCTFENNGYDDTDFGLVIANSTAGLCYEYCIFRGNRGKLLSISNVESGSASPSFDLNNCSFEDCDGSGLIFARDGTLVGAVSFDTCDFKSCDALIIELVSVGPSLTLSGCLFEECTASDSGMISLGELSQESTTKIDLSDNRFVKCRNQILSTKPESVSEVSFNHNEVSEWSGSGSLLTLSTGNLSLVDNSFVSITSTSSSAILISVANGTSKVQDNFFIVSSNSHPLIDFSCAEATQVEFYNCCFAHSESLGSTYIKMDVAGNVVFSEGCFDVEESQAITYANGKDKVEFSGNRDDFFNGTCHCWGGFNSELPEDSSPTDEATAPGPDDNDTNNKVDPGLIAGVVVGVLVVIAIVVVVVILLLRRRKSDDEEEEMQEDQELAEETVTTMTQSAALTASGWSQTTEESPVFLNAAAIDGESPFDALFEEDVV